MNNNSDNAMHQKCAKLQRFDQKNVFFYEASALKKSREKDR